MRIVIAPDSFKGSITAADAAEAIASGWREVRPGDEIRCLPLADGGEGTLAALTSRGGTLMPTPVQDPIGRPRTASWALLPDGTAVVELASACGLPLLETPAPLTASTFGFGQLLRAAAEHPEVRRIVATLGGSATTDGGAGALTALGAVFHEDGSVDLSALVPFPDVVCLVDVDTPLLGPTGAARRFGPQKGASPADVEVLEARLTTFAGLLGGDPGTPGAGAAGGTAFGLATAWGARLVPGAPCIAGLVGLPEAVERADLLITGEGRLDEQSWSGKVVGNAVDGAGRVALVVGSRATEVPDGMVCLSLDALAGDVRRAMEEPARWLAAAGKLLAADASGGVW